MKKCLLGIICVLMTLGIVFSAGCSRIQQTGAAANLPEVRSNDTAIQWKYSDETDWHDLVALDELRGVNGQNGNDGAAGKDGTNGKNGADGANGIDGKDGTNGSDGVDGKNGTDGTNGINGKDGTDGINGTDGKDGLNGNDGINGVDGKDGTDGINGVDGKDGINGKNIEVQRTTEYIQWRYEGEDWQNLVAIADIEGPSGQNGKDGENGKTPEFRVNENLLQWRYEGDGVWLNLYDLSLLKGIDGKDGADGTNGQNGSDGRDGKTPFIGENGNWWIDTIDTGIKAEGTDGADGDEIEIQKTDSYIQWRYKGGEWQNLVSLADIEGPSGQNGADGENGKTPEFRVNGNQLQWRYIGDTTWLNLYDLSSLKGSNGINGINGKNGKDGKDGVCAGYFNASGTAYFTNYKLGQPLPFTVKQESGNLISYNTSSKTITLTKGHAYSLVFSGTVNVMATSDNAMCGMSLIDGYNDSMEMLQETKTCVLVPTSGQDARLSIPYNTIYKAEDDITLTFQYSNMLLQNTRFSDSKYSVTIIALD